ncbi:threonine ammonia-lyase [Pontiella sp.]|uniref:threonine ammonia-lyase n=1 Tax=Pontiella sp. TaxID=2837462 RepID=UPI003569F067
MVSKIDIEQAYENVKGNVIETPLRRAQVFSDLAGCDMLLKMETQQMSGAFKERGALNRLLQLSEEEKKRGIIAASAGNHAQGVAYHAHRMGIRAVIVMPESTPLVKVTGVQFWGAEVILHGTSYDDAYALSRELEHRQGLVYVHPFADPWVIAGQGTIAIEVLDHELGADLDAIVVPIGGGGLIAGIGAYVKRVRPDVKVIGVEVEGFACMKDSLAAGAVQTLVGTNTIADGIAVKRVSENTFALCRDYVDEIVTVTDDEISNAILMLLEYEKVVVEGAGAVAVAALLNKKIGGVAGKKVVSVVSGGNIDITMLSRIIDRGLEFGGRIAQFSTPLKDSPGALEKVLGIIRKAGANILEVYQHRYSKDVPVGEVNVSFTIETRNRQHIAEIESQLRVAGYEVFRSHWKPSED